MAPAVILPPEKSASRATFFWLDHRFISA